MSILFEETQIIAPPGSWAELRSNESFVELMRLARVANSLALAYGPLLSNVDDQSPKARRERFGGLFYSAAVLEEGLRTARTLGKWFRELEQYREGFAALFADPAVQALESTVLCLVRNEIVFHFDRTPLEIGLSRLPEAEVLLCTYPSSGPEVGHTYFDVADDAMLGYLFGDAATDGEYLARLSDFMVGTSDLFNRFMKAAHRLVAAGLLSLGCKKRKGIRELHDDDTVTLR
jgi:hypothetical protein